MTQAPLNKINAVMGLLMVCVVVMTSCSGHLLTSPQPLTPTSSPSGVPTATSLPSPTVTSTFTPKPAGTATLTSELTVPATAKTEAPAQAREYLVFVSDQIYMVDAQCVQEPMGCEHSWIRLTDTPKRRREFRTVSRGVTVSPDGRFLAFAYSADEKADEDLVYSDWDIYFLDIQECQSLPRGCPPERFKRLTTQPTMETNPAWSPSGDKIVFVSFAPRFPEHLMVMNADGSQMRLLALRESREPIPGFFPSWAPDSDHLAYNEALQQYVHPDLRVNVVDLAGSEIKHLTNPVHSEPDNREDWHPYWSPDGAKIVFTRRYRDDSDGIYLIDSAGGKATRIDNQECSSALAWSPDSTRIICDGEKGTAIMDIDGKNLQWLMAPEHAISGLVWMTISGY
mgnify:CR=1 FL=1